MYNLDEKREKIEKIVGIVAGLAICFFVAPFIFATIQGLVGLIITGVIGYTAIQFMPVFAAKIANWRLKAIKAEAAANPVETLQNDFEFRKNALLQFRKAIVDFGGQVKVFRDKLDGFKKQYPSEAPRFDEQYNNMLALLDVRKKKYEQAKVNLALYSEEITKAKAMWEMAQAAAAMTRAAGMSDNDFLQKIQRETAIDSVQKSLSSTFSELELSLQDEASTQKSIMAAKQPIVIETKIPRGKSDPTLELDLETI